MTKFATTSQWYRVNPERKAPREVSLPLSSRDGGELVKVASNGAQLRKAVQ